jgi:hypothetical protein
MSFITPKKYREIANVLGTAYGDVRDVLHSSGTDDAESFSSGTSYGYAKYVVDTIVDATDDNTDADSIIVHSVVKDPSGSVASDLGSSSTSFANSLIQTSAEKDAASYFSAILQKLNSHVIKRTQRGVVSGSPSPTLTTIRSYYDAYSLTTGSEEMSLHSSNGTSYDASLYFNADFVDLMSQINVDLTSYLYRTA